MLANTSSRSWLYFEKTKCPSINKCRNKGFNSINIIQEIQDNRAEATTSHRKKCTFKMQ